MEGVLELGRLYRVTVADLALARRQFPGDPRARPSRSRCAEGAPAVYGERRRRRLGARIPHARRTGARSAPTAALLALSLSAMFVPTLLAGTWAILDPGAAIGLVPGAYRAAASPQVRHLSAGLSTQAAFASSIYTHNIEVMFLVFAGGITLGLRARSALLAYNGLLLGTLGGLTIQSGTFEVFVRYIVPHGLLELSCISIAGVAGLRLARALIEPGVRTRARGAQRRGAGGGGDGVRDHPVAGLRGPHGGLRDPAGAAPVGSRWRSASRWATFCSGRWCVDGGRHSRRRRLRAQVGLQAATRAAPAGSPAPRRRRASRCRRPRDRGRGPCWRPRAHGRGPRPAPLRPPRAPGSRTRGHDHRMAAGEHRGGPQQRARGSLVDRSVNTITSPRREPPTRRKARSKSESVPAGWRSNSAPTTSRPPSRRGASARRMAASNAIAPQRSPSSSAASATWRPRRGRRRAACRAPAGAPISRPQSIRHTTSWSCSIRYWLLIGRPRRAVARQLTWRMSSSGEYSRIDSKSVPSPSGPRRSLPVAAPRDPCAQLQRELRARGRFGYTRAPRLAVGGGASAPSPSGPTARARDARAARGARDAARHDPVGAHLRRARGVERERGRRGLAKQHATRRRRQTPTASATGYAARERRAPPRA